MKTPEYKKWFPGEFSDMVIEPDDEEIEDDILYREKVEFAAESARDIDLSDSLHWIVEFIGGPGALLSNAIFIKFYKKIDLRPLVRASDGFLFGLIAGAFFSVIGVLTKFGYKWDYALLVALAPLFVSLLYIWIRTGYTILIEAPLKIASEVDHGVIHSVYTTPLTDADLYYGTSMPFLVRSLVVFESAIYFTGGYFVPWFVFNAPFVFRSVVTANYGYSEYFYFTATGLILFTLITLLSTLLASRAMGLYSVIFSRVGTIWAAFGHSFLAWLGITVLGYMVILPYLAARTTAEISFGGIMFGIFLGSGIMIAAYWYASVLTAQIGIWLVGRSRRGPGKDPMRLRRRNRPVSF